jgi:hypothetical protein
MLSRRRRRWRSGGRFLLGFYSWFGFAELFDNEMAEVNLDFQMAQHWSTTALLILRHHAVSLLNVGLQLLQALPLAEDARYFDQPTHVPAIIHPVFKRKGLGHILTWPIQTILIYKLQGAIASVYSIRAKLARIGRFLTIFLE